MRIDYRKIALPEHPARDEAGLYLRANGKGKLNWGLPSALHLPELAAGPEESPATTLRSMLMGAEPIA